MIGHDLIETHHLDRTKAVELFGPLSTARSACPRCSPEPNLKDGEACEHGVRRQTIDAPWADWRSRPLGELYATLRANGYDVDGVDPAALVRRIHLGTLGRRSNG